MLEPLTLTDLYELHADLFTDGSVLHASIMDPVTYKPLVPTLSPEWYRVSKIHEAILNTMLAIDAEIDVRIARGEKFDALQYGARSAGA